MLVVYAISFGPLLSLYLLQDGHLNWGQLLDQVLDRLAMKGQASWEEPVQKSEA